MTTPEDPDAARRLRASALIRRGEAAVQRAWFGSLTRWLDRVRPQVLADDQVQASNVGQNAAYWGELMREEVVPEAASLYQRVRNRITGRADPVTDADAARYLNEVGNRLVRLPDEVYALIVREIETGIAQGQSIPDISARVQTVLTSTGSEYWPNRARTVARTETASAVNAGAYAGAVRDAEERGDPAPFKVWLCVAPDTSVVAPSVKFAARRHYVGPLVRVTTASGSAVSLTPEHPVLTGRGWIAAKLVDKSDHLFRVPGVDASRTPQVQDAPPGIGQVIDSIMQTEPSEVRSMPVGMDLNGDSPHHDVQVVAVHGDLSSHVEPLISKELGYLGLMCADDLALSLCLGCGSCQQLVGPHTTTPELGTGPLSLGLLEGSTLSSSAQDPGLALATDTYSCAFQDLGNSKGGASNGTADDGGALTGLVEADDVVSVEIISFSGHVYDLTTDGGWYVANSLLLHNSTDDTRTRPTHHEADGQRTLLTEPFIVGGARLLYPGDPRGPAQEVIQCRCSFLPITLGETLDWTSRQDP